MTTLDTPGSGTPVAHARTNAGMANGVAHLTAAQLGRSPVVEIGMSGINHFTIQGPATPFGGIRESGYGSEGGPDRLVGFLPTELVSQA